MQVREPDPSAASVEPRLAATVLLVRDDPFQVLLVKRSAIGSFPSRRVFPGGVVEREDMDERWRSLCRGGDDLNASDLAFRIAGIRECWEEAGVLCMVNGDLDGLSGSRSDGLFSLMERCDVHFDLGHMADFAHWVTPPTAPKRWDTRFLLARAPRDHILCCDGVETVAADWVEPKEVLERDADGIHGLLFSTKANLHLLALSDCVDDALEAARNRPLFRVTPSAQRKDGKFLVSIPSEAGYPVSEGWVDDAPRL
ncbi:NUDIX hydrolase [Porphyrobacter sp. MBR-49]|jgi:8-oxo-dGTP pyrophosphatase MutT (NUDIX family)